MSLSQVPSDPIPAHHRIRIRRPKHHPDIQWHTRKSSTIRALVGSITAVERFPFAAVQLLGGIAPSPSLQGFALRPQNPRYRTPRSPHRSRRWFRSGGAAIPCRATSEMSSSCIVLQAVEEVRSKPRVSGASNSSSGTPKGKKMVDSGGDPIWESIRTEAKCEAEKEPILSSFLYASVLSHDCLERSLGFVLANRLQNPTLLATQLMDIFVDVMMNDRGIGRAIRLDVQAFKDRDAACASYSWALLYLKGYHSLQSYRVAHVLWNQGRKVLAVALQSRISEVFAVDIHPAAKIGEGILLDHGTGLVIGETAVVGNRVSLMQGVTLGGTGKEVGDRHPKIGQGALIGARATILGSITVGEGAMIVAGSVVLKNVPAHSIAAGNPAKVVGRVKERDPSLTMKQDATKDYFDDAAVNSTGERVNGTLDSTRL